MYIPVAVKLGDTDSVNVVRLLDNHLHPEVACFLVLFFPTSKESVVNGTYIKKLKMTLAFSCGINYRVVIVWSRNRVASHIERRHVPLMNTAIMPSTGPKFRPTRWWRRIGVLSRCGRGPVRWGCLVRGVDHRLLHVRRHEWRGVRILRSIIVRLHLGRHEWMGVRVPRSISVWLAEAASGWRAHCLRPDWPLGIRSGRRHWISNGHISHPSIVIVRLNAVRWGRISVIGLVGFVRIAIPRHIPFIVYLMTCSKIWKKS